MVWSDLWGTLGSWRKKMNSPWVVQKSIQCLSVPITGCQRKKSASEALAIWLYNNPRKIQVFKVFHMVILRSQNFIECQVFTMWFGLSKIKEDKRIVSSFWHGFTTVLLHCTERGIERWLCNWEKFRMRGLWDCSMKWLTDNTGTS